MLTVIIPCKNESHNIQACVESARLLGGEIIVADNGSTDGTLELVSKMTDCRLIEREFKGYSSFKNWAIPQAKFPWVLILDADERVTEKLATEILAILKAPPANIDAYWIGRRTFFFGGEARFGPWLNDGVVRLLRRDECRYDDSRVHEGLTVPKDRCQKLKHKLLHYTIASYDEYFAKYIRYTRLGASDRWDRGKRTSTSKLLLSPILRFLWLYIARGGFLDGALGVQTCMLQAFFVTFIKQGRLWEMERCQQETTAKSVVLQMPQRVAIGLKQAA